MFDEKTYDLIDAYINGRLSTEALAAFVKRMEAEPELRQEVDIQRVTIDLLLEEDLINDLANWKEELPQEDNISGEGGDSGKVVPLRSRRSPNTIWWRVAAAAVFIGILAYVGGLLSPGNGIELDDEQLVQEVPAVDTSSISTLPDKPGDTMGAIPSNPPPTPPTVSTPDQRPVDSATPSTSAKPLIALANELFNTYDREATQTRTKSSSQASSPSDLARVFSAYDTAAYQAVIDTIELLFSQDHPQYNQAQLLLGDAYFQLEAFDQAKVAYLRVMESGFFNLVERAEFYYLLSALALQEMDEPAFSELMERIIEDDGHTYHQPVATLKDRLE